MHTLFAQSSPPPDNANESDAPAKTDLALNEMQVVEAFSRISVPEDILRNSNVPQMVKDMRTTKKLMESSEEKLSQLRREKKDSNFLSNMWSDRDDQIEDAESNVNSEFRKLGALSANLLILNTAMAKIMNGQQGALQDQQSELEHQARDIEKQNSHIKEHQELLASNQREFSKAAQALAEAKGLTQAQASELVGCVRKVVDSERSMLESHGRLMAQVEERLRLIASDWSEIVTARLAQFEDVHTSIEMRVEERLAASDASALDKFAAAQARSQDFANQLASMAAREAWFSEALEKQRKEMRIHRIVHAFGGLAIVTLFFWMAMGRAALPH